MVSYEEVKKRIVDQRPRVIQILSLVIVFFLGYGTGQVRSVSDLNIQKQKKEQPNYTIKTSDKPEVNPPPAAITDTKLAPPAVAPGECVVKGNISSKSKIYHSKGGAFYDRVKPEQCFPDEASARAAGFTKSQR